MATKGPKQQPVTLQKAGVILDKWFSNPLCKLPVKLRPLAQEASSGFWDQLDADHRRCVIDVWDQQHRETDEEREIQERDFTETYYKEVIEDHTRNAAVLNSIKWETERKQKSHSRKNKKISKLPRPGRQKFSDAQLVEASKGTTYIPVIVRRLKANYKIEVDEKTVRRRRKNLPQ